MHRSPTSLASWVGVIHRTLISCGCDADGILLAAGIAPGSLHTPQARDARLPLMQAVQLQPAQRRILSNVAVYLLLFGKDQEAAQWMQQHQMGAPLRQQVFQQAQQLEVLQRTPEPALPLPLPAAASIPDLS